MKIAIRTVMVKGRKRWVVDYLTESGKRRRLSYESQRMANSAASKIKNGIEIASRSWGRLAVHEREAIMLAFYEAKRRGVSLADIISSVKSNGEFRSPPLSKVIDEMCKAKLATGKSNRYVTSLKTVLNQFASGRSSVPVASISVVSVESFLESKKLASRSTLRARLSTLFKFAIRRGYRLDNPCARIEPVKYIKAPPAVFDLVQFKASWTWLVENAPHGLAWFVLSACCGLRPEEAEKTTEADIHFTEGYVKVEAQTAKVRQRRVVYPKPEAMMLLQRAVDIGGRLPLLRSSRVRIICGESKAVRWKPVPGRERKFTKPRVRIPKQGLRDALGFKAWPKDITRHTAASYWLADCGSAAIVAEALGNSEGILKRDYKAIKTRVEAAAFWKLVRDLAS